MQLKTITIRGREYFVDDTLHQLRAVDNPHDTIEEHEAIAMIIEERQEEEPVTDAERANGPGKKATC